MQNFLRSTWISVFYAHNARALILIKFGLNFVGCGVAGKHNRSASFIVDFGSNSVLINVAYAPCCPPLYMISICIQLSGWPIFF